MRGRTILQERRAQLVGPDGTPIMSKRDTLIPLIRHNPSPGIKRSLHEIDRGPRIYALALQFLSRGGRYACQLTPWRKHHLVAGFPVKGGTEGEMVLVAEEITENTPDAVGQAVDRVVAASVRDMDRVIQGESRVDARPVTLQ